MRILSLLASATDIVCALGAGDQLVGRSHECDHPAWVRRLPSCTSAAFDVNMSSRQIDTEVRRRMKERLPLYHVDAQAIADLKPDVLITQAHCEVCAVTPGNLEQAGCALAAPVTLALQAGTLAGICEDIQAIAAAIGIPAEGRALIQKIHAGFDRVRAAVAGRRRPSLAMLEWTDPVFAMANWGPELVTIAGGTVLLGERGLHSTAINWNTVLAADPEFLLIAPCGFSLERSILEITTMESHPGWFDLRAVREGNVFFADGNLFFNRSGTTIVETAEIIADILHGTRLLQPAQSAWRRYAPVAV